MPMSWRLKMRSVVICSLSSPSNLIRTGNSRRFERQQVGRASVAALSIKYHADNNWRLKVTWRRPGMHRAEATGKRADRSRLERGPAEPSRGKTLEGVTLAAPSLPPTSSPPRARFKYGHAGLRLWYRLTALSLCRRHGALYRRLFERQRQQQGALGPFWAPKSNHGTSN